MEKGALINDLDKIARWFEHRMRVYRAEAEIVSEHPKAVYLAVAHDNDMRARAIREAAKRLMDENKCQK